MYTKDIPEYRVWGHMVDRCENPRNDAYEKYGGRGIKVDPKWRSFNRFFADMGPRPSPLHEIDRIDNNGNYAPGNCRWTTVKEQARNRRSNVLIEFGGEKMCKAAWAEKLGITRQSLHVRLKKWPLEKALTMERSH